MPPVKIDHYEEVSVDITERKRAEQELSTARDTGLEGVRIKSEFMANMSHEIRTPLNGILGINELLLDSGLNAEQSEYATTAAACGRLLMDERSLQRRWNIAKPKTTNAQIQPSNPKLDRPPPLYLIEMRESAMATSRDYNPDLPATARPRRPHQSVGGAARTPRTTLSQERKFAIGCRIGA